MKKNIYIIIVVAVIAYSLAEQQGYSIPGFSSPGNSAVQSAYDNRQSDLQVQGEGVVIKVLADDRQGSRHQRFILKVSNGPSLLVAHNIDLAPRVDGLNEGDTIAFNGEYEWNEKGGVLHWTHHDPAGRHIDGWLKHRGRTYQ